MTLTEIGALIQSGILSALAVILVLSIPKLWKEWLSYIERTRAYEANEDQKERDHRHELANRYAAGLADLRLAIIELKEASRDICSYRHHHRPEAPLPTTTNPLG